MKKLFDGINRFFLPDKPGIDESKYNILISFYWLTSLFSLFYVLVSLIISYDMGIYIMLLNFVGLTVNLFLIRHKIINYRVAANVYLANCAFIAVLGCTWFSGGLFSPVIPWFALIPVTSMLLLGTKRNTLIWLIITSLLLLMFFVIEKNQPDLVQIRYNKDWQKFFFYTCLAGIVLILFLVTQVFENIKNKALNEVSSKNDELKRAIDQLKNAQEQLVQQEKLASLGQLTAGIAHEIKNPLNFVNNFSQLSIELLNELREEKNEDIKQEIFEDLTSNLTKIKHHGTRADFIVKSMLQHSRSGSSEFQDTDLNKICEEYFNLAYHGIRATDKTFNCKLEKSLDENLPLVNCVAQDISRVILNLVNNAMYAVRPVENPTVSISSHYDGKNVLITVKDNGTGMDEETKRKLFEPFYTTKPTGQGTGLGLSISFDIIKAHAGTLEMQSELGKGTSFMISLPVRQK